MIIFRKRTHCVNLWTELIIEVAWFEIVWGLLWNLILFGCALVRFSEWWLTFFVLTFSAIFWILFCTFTRFWRDFCWLLHLFISTYTLILVHSLVFFWSCLLTHLFLCGLIKCKVIFHFLFCRLKLTRGWGSKWSFVWRRERASRPLSWCLLFACWLYWFCCCGIILANFVMLPEPYVVE